MKPYRARRALAALCLALLCGSFAFAAGTVTQTIEQVGPNYVVTLSWTADASDGTVPSTAVASDSMATVKGFYLFMAETDPGATAPTDNYDIVVNNAAGVDVMAGALANRDTANSEQALTVTASRLVDTTLTMVLSNNSVNSATGTLKLYFSRLPGAGTGTAGGGGGGDASLAEQQTQTTALQLIDDVVHAVNGAIGKSAAIGGQLDDTGTTAATENNVAPVRVTAQRGVHANLRANDGTEIGTSGAPVRTDPTGTTTQPVSGTVTANAGTGNMGANVTQLGGNAVSAGNGASGTGTLRVTVASDSTGTLAVTQGTASSLKVEPAGNVAAGAADSGNPLKVGAKYSASLPTLDDGDRGDLQTDVNGRLLVKPDGVDVAHDAADSGNPVKIGAKAVDLGATPTAVASADRTDLYALRNGILLTLGGHMNAVTLEAAYTAAQTDTAIVTVSAGTAIVVTQIQVVVDAATSVDVGFRVGFGTANTPTTTGVVLTHPGLDATAGGGVSRGMGGGIIGIGASDADLRITSEVPTDGSLRVLVTYFTIAIG